MSLFPLSNYAAGTAPIASPTPTVPAVGTRPSGDSGTVQVPNTAAVAATKEVAPDSAESVKLDQAVDSINKFLKPVASSLEFSIDPDSQRTVVQVIDTDTKDVLRQYPSKQALAMSQELDKLQGLLLRDKA